MARRSRELAALRALAAAPLPEIRAWADRAALVSYLTRMHRHHPCSLEEHKSVIREEAKAWSEAYGDAMAEILSRVLDGLELSEETRQKGVDLAIRELRKIGEVTR